ncbi:hypothetical protein L798_10102 [Zootermopsis nevadensis]|uniref:Uncharacterized protein n=1 Tax=Zootermopsis nevadensis TaxID=136037 RepID=A0A067QZX1_ZOONE|nr:hypothetical protein L798_10102 [Zootermopsis nevadensis]
MFITKPVDYLTPDEFFMSGPDVVAPLGSHQQVDGGDFWAGPQQLFHQHLTHESGASCDEDASSFEEPRDVRGRVHGFASVASENF